MALWFFLTGCWATVLNALEVQVGNGDSGVQGFTGLVLRYARSEDSELCTQGSGLWLKVHRIQYYPHPIIPEPQMRFRVWGFRV